MKPEREFECAAESPYDSRPRKKVDWAQKTARAVLHNLLDRQGIKFGFAMVDNEIRIQIVEELADIIRYGGENINGENNG